MIRVLLVDDNAGFLDWAVKFLSVQPRMTVVGTALNGADAVDMARALCPDLVLMDVAMPGMNGLEAAKRIRSATAHPRTVIMTIHDLPHYRAAAAATADGFIAKPEFGSALMPVIERLFPQEDHTNG